MENNTGASLYNRLLNDLILETSNGTWELKPENDMQINDKGWVLQEQRSIRINYICMLSQRIYQDHITHNFSQHMTIFI